MDAFRVQKWMGHKNIATTRQYVTLYGADLHPLADALDKRREDVHAFVPRSIQIEGAVVILSPLKRWNPWGCWGDEWGLNPRPTESQSVALPTELPPPQIRPNKQTQTRHAWLSSKTLTLNLISGKPEKYQVIDIYQTGFLAKSQNSSAGGMIAYIWRTVQRLYWFRSFCTYGCGS